MVGSKHAGVLRVMSLGISSSGMPTASLRGDLGDREPGGFGRQRRTARDARIHLDDDHPPGFRIDGELDVRPAGLHAHLANDRCARRRASAGIPYRSAFAQARR